MVRSIRPSDRTPRIITAVAWSDTTETPTGRSLGSGRAVRSGTSVTSEPPSILGQGGSLPISVSTSECPRTAGALAWFGAESPASTSGAFGANRASAALIAVRSSCMAAGRDWWGSAAHPGRRDQGDPFLPPADHDVNHHEERGKPYQRIGKSAKRPHHQPTDHRCHRTHTCACAFVDNALPDRSTRSPAPGPPSWSFRTAPHGPGADRTRRNLAIALHEPADRFPQRKVRSPPMRNPAPTTLETRQEWPRRPNALARCEESRRSAYCAGARRRAVAATRCCPNPVATQPSNRARPPDRNSVSDA